MVRVISKHQFLLRVKPGGQRESVKRGQAVMVTEEEYKKFAGKFILYSEYAHPDDKR